MRLAGKPAAGDNTGNKGLLTTTATLHEGYVFPCSHHDVELRITCASGRCTTCPLCQLTSTFLIYARKVSSALPTRGCRSLLSVAEIVQQASGTPLLFTFCDMHHPTSMKVLQGHHLPYSHALPSTIANPTLPSSSQLSHFLHRKPGDALRQVLPRCANFGPHRLPAWTLLRRGLRTTHSLQRRHFRQRVWPRKRFPVPTCSR